jgi:integrase
LRLVLRRAVDDRIVVADPSAKLRLPRVEPVDRRIPTPDQVEALLESITPRARALIAVGAGLGLRQGEAFGLSRDRIDWTRRTVKIDRQLKRSAAGGVVLGTLKTRRSYRTVPMPNTVALELGAHVERFPSDDPDGLVFVGAWGGRLRREVWGRDVLKPATTAIGVEWLTFHTLRHFYASALIRAGHGAPIVAARMGNTAQMVHETYAHLWPDDDDRTRAAIDQMWNLRAPDAHQRSVPSA